jgi:hypothetical protein
MLPYTADILFSVHDRFLTEWGWLSALIGLAALAGAGLAQIGRDPGGRVLGAAIAAGWAWVGAGFFLGPMAALDFSAPIYGGVFLAQAAVLLWAGPVCGQLGLKLDRRPRALAGAALLAVAVIVLPLTDGLVRAEWFGLRPVFAAPGTTALATLALLLTVRRTPPLVPALLPFLWCMAAAAIGWTLAIPADIALLPLALAALALLIAVRRAC